MNSTLFRDIIKTKKKRPHFSILLITIIPSTSILFLKIIGWLVIYINGLGFKKICGQDGSKFVLALAMDKLMGTIEK